MQYSEADLEILRRARYLANTLTAESLALIQVKVPVPYNKRGKGNGPPSKGKGGHAPIDFDAVETLQDLRCVLAVDRPDPERVLPLYIRLRGLVGG